MKQVSIIIVIMAWLINGTNLSDNALGNIIQQAISQQYPAK